MCVNVTWGTARHHNACIIHTAWYDGIGEHTVNLYDYLWHVNICWTRLVKLTHHIVVLCHRLCDYKFLWNFHWPQLQIFFFFLKIFCCTVTWCHFCILSHVFQMWQSRHHSPQRRILQLRLLSSCSLLPLWMGLHPLLPLQSLNQSRQTPLSVSFV